MVERGVRDIAGAEYEVADTGPLDIGQESGRRREFTCDVLASLPLRLQR